MATNAVEGADTPMEDAPPEHHITIDDKPTELTVRMEERHGSRADPDAQTTVTDFLDFTEYLPSDIVRSLTLIGKLDEAYVDASINVNDLTRKWGQLPTLEQKERPSTVQLRADISEQLSQALSSRVASHAEATKVSETINRHYHKVQVLLSKLQAMMENYPTDEELLEKQASKSPQLSRSKPAVASAGEKKVRRHRAPRITVPGEVLAPYEIEYDNFSDSDDESSEEEDDVMPNIRRTPAPVPRIKLVAQKTPKPVNRPGPRSTPQTSAAMTIAAAANAAALLKPPPPDAVVGSTDAPWLQLTQYELAKLRKRMKKNATWTPSETMVARELKSLGRGPDDYRAAKKKAEDDGQSFDAAVPAPVLDSESGATALPAGAISADSLAAEEVPTSNRGMKLNEAKKLKREALAKQAAEEAEESARKMAEAAKQFLGAASTASSSESPKDAKPAKQPRNNSRSNNKRKREDGEPMAASPAPSEPSLPSAPPAAKRTKTETPVPLPQNVKTRHNSGSNAENAGYPSTAQGTAANSAASQTPVPVPLPPLSASSSVVGAAKSPTPGVARPYAPETPVPVPRADRHKSTTIVPLPQDAKTSETSKRETRGEAAKRAQQQEGESPEVPTSELFPEQNELQRRRSSRGVTPAAPVEEGDAPTARRPSSRGKTASLEPQPSVAADRSRRTSTARNTPVPEPRPVRRFKRPAPGVVSTTSSGSSSAVGKRKSAPKKKARVKKEKGQGIDEMEEVDDEGNPIDPDEPKYCYCNRVSFGTMIKCDNEVRETEEEQSQLSSGRTLRSSASEDAASKGCKYEWFHLECVGLTSEPAETTKWYCPDCRKLLQLGEKGQVNVRGVKK